MYYDWVPLTFPPFPVLRNPVLFILLCLLAGGTYLAYNLNLLGPMMQMANAASNQAVDIGKQKLRDFLEHNETARTALAMPARKDTGISLDTLDSQGKRQREDEDEDEI